MTSGGTPRIATDKELVSVNNSNFVKVQDWSDFFYSAPAKGTITYFGFSRLAAMYETLIVDNTFYTLSGNSSTGVGYFGVAKHASESLGNSIGELASWGTNCLVSLEAVVYDQTNSRFYYVPTNGAYFLPFGSQDLTSAKFDVNNTGGLKLLYGDWGASYYDYMLFSKGDSRYLGIANFYRATATASNVGVGFYDVSSSPNIQNATSFATNYLGQYVLYGAGNSVYNLAYNSGKDATAIWTAPSGDEVVTSIATQKFYFSTLFLRMMPNVNSVIHIATWNEKTREGKLYQYMINPASGTILTDQESHEYTVPGKVKDMGWKYAMEM